MPGLPPAFYSCVRQVQQKGAWLAASVCSRSCPMFLLLLLSFVPGSLTTFSNDGSWLKRTRGLVVMGTAARHLSLLAIIDLAETETLAVGVRYKKLILSLTGRSLAPPAPGISLARTRHGASPANALFHHECFRLPLLLAEPIIHDFFIESPPATYSDAR
jgi:hypothetical protein